MGAVETDRDMIETTEHAHRGLGSARDWGSCRSAVVLYAVPPPAVGAWWHSAHSAHMTGRNWGFLLQPAILLPIQTILHPHNVGQPHNAIRILFVPTAAKVQRYGEEAVAEITVYTKGASPYPQLERGQSISKFLIDTTNLSEKMQKKIDQYTTNEGKACKQLI